MNVMSYDLFPNLFSNSSAVEPSSRKCLANTTCSCLVGRRATARLPSKILVCAAVSCVGNDHSPSLVSVQLMENRVVTVLKHQVKFPLPSEDFNKVHKVGMFELLKTQKPRFAKLGL